MVTRCEIAFQTFVTYINRIVFDVMNILECEIATTIFAAVEISNAIFTYITVIFYVCDFSTSVVLAAIAPMTTVVTVIVTAYKFSVFFVNYTATVGADYFI